MCSWHGWSRGKTNRIGRSFLDNLATARSGVKPLPLPGRGPLSLCGDSGAWRWPRRGREPSLKGSTRFKACQHRSSPVGRYWSFIRHSGPTPHFDPSWSCLCASCRLECCLSLSEPLLYPLYSARASSSSVVTFRFTKTVEKAAVGRARRGGKGGDEVERGGGRRRKRRAVVFILWVWEKGFPRSSSTRLSDLPGRDEAVVQEGAQNSLRKGAHLGPSNEDGRARETRDSRREALTLLARCEC